MNELCDERQIQKLVAELSPDSMHDLAKLEGMLTEFPNDPRLHLLHGSCLVEKGKLIEAQQAFAMAVNLDPDFAIARFQLGFFQLTSGEANSAMETWSHLDALDDGHYLKIFTTGLGHLVRDEFKETIQTLEVGISVNTENIPLNNNMRLIIEHIRPLVDEVESVVTGKNNDTDVMSVPHPPLGRGRNP